MPFQIFLPTISVLRETEMISDRNIPVLQLPIKKRYMMSTQSPASPSAQIYIKDNGKGTKYEGKVHLIHQEI